MEDFHLQILNIVSHVLHTLELTWIYGKTCWMESDVYEVFEIMYSLLGSIPHFAACWMEHVAPRWNYTLYICSWRSCMCKNRQIFLKG